VVVHLGLAGLEQANQESIAMAQMEGLHVQRLEELHHQAEDLQDHHS
jgi:hypothetical protein